MTPNMTLIVKHIDGEEFVSKLAYDTLLGEYQATKRDADEMRKNGAMIDPQKEDLTRLRNEHVGMKHELDELALFVREHYEQEIAMGQHANMKGMVDVVKFYLGKERMKKK